MADEDKIVVGAGGKFIKVLDQEDIETLLKEAKFKTLKNDDFEILKILGNNNIEGAPEEKYLGAIINTTNKKYPALVLQMNIDGELSEYEFDQILNSIQSNN